MVVLMSLAATAEDFYDFKVDGIAYKINEEDAATVSVTKEQDPNIPETNYTSYANLTGKLTLPEQVTHDGVTYTVTAIGEEAFQGCSGLTGELLLPGTIKQIDHWAFYQCSGLTGHVVIPTGVTTIGYSAFGECDGLTGFTIPATVRSIDPGALDGAGVQMVVSLIGNIWSTCIPTEAVQLTKVLRSPKSPTPKLPSLRNEKTGTATPARRCMSCQWSTMYDDARTLLAVTKWGMVQRSSRIHFPSRHTPYR